MLTKSDLEAIDGLITNRLDQKLKPVNKRLRKIEKDVSTMLDVLDRADVKMQKKVSKIEEVVGLA